MIAKRRVHCWSVGLPIGLLCFAAIFSFFDLAVLAFSAAIPPATFGTPRKVKKGMEVITASRLLTELQILRDQGCSAPFIAMDIDETLAWTG